jgi:hypothetical protein
VKVRTLFLILINSLFLLLLNCCAHSLENNAASVDVYYSLAEKTNCDYVGDVIGSDGNYLTFLFISNTDLTRGALNNIRNNAMAMGGDSVFILREKLQYSTTTTFVGSVYSCHK